jgi:hypothetical protein
MQTLIEFENTKVRNLIIVASSFKTVKQLAPQMQAQKMNLFFARYALRSFFVPLF